MPPEHERDYVDASDHNGGCMVYIPKGMLDNLPTVDPEADLEVKRYPSNDRDHVHLSFRNS